MGCCYCLLSCISFICCEINCIADRIRGLNNRYPVSRIFISVETLRSEPVSDISPQFHVPHIVDPIQLPDTECNICFLKKSDDDILIWKDLECSHKFHANCIDSWFVQSVSQPSCPLCRRIISLSNMIPHYIGRHGHTGMPQITMF
jgi:hypothetical protein